MTSATPRKKVGLTERRFALVCRGVFLLIALASAVITLICILRGYQWPTPSITGGPGVASTVALAVEGWRGKVH
jgi:hypothetical protein